ncbi:MAG: DNA-binding protein [Alphaproteobacteria bacterium]
MAKTATRPWDPAEHLETEADIAAYLDAAIEDGEPAVVTAALGDVVRAKVMARAAVDADQGGGSNGQATE